MQGASRQSLAQARDAVAARSADPAFGEVSAELLSVSALLGRESGLRSALSDPSDDPARRAELAATVLGTHVSPLTASVLDGVVQQRWSSGRDLVDAIETLGLDAAFIAAEQAGRIDAVEDELFRFARVVEASAELRSLLTDHSIDDQQKAALVDDLLAGKVSVETARLVRHVTANPRGRRLEDAIDGVVQAASVRREQLLAEVTTAVELTDEQSTRLETALTRIYGRTVRCQVSVDPAVLGGVSVRVGDEIIDGTVLHRVAEAKQAFGS